MNVRFYTKVLKKLGLAIDCGRPSTPTNGSVHGERTTYPNVLKFQCDEGFTLLGPILRKCQTNGTWSGVDAICQGTVMVHFHSWKKSIKTCQTDGRYSGVDLFLPMSLNSSLL